ncbi:MAG: hypothetical protein LBQ94_03455 [Treponema sp.]|jgi:hypothetical protein|nr:hypothetical protein [Treponema sp.]
MANLYKKTLDDEIDWKIIDQLHNSTINFSSATLETKKLLFVLLGIAVPALIKLADDTLDLSLFVTLYIIIAAFWFLDGFAFHYQEKLRMKMDEKFRKIKMRNNLVIEENETFTIDDRKNKKCTILHMIINFSLGIYFVLILLNTIAFILYLRGIIK